MASIVQRNLQRSLAKSVSILQEETGLPQEQILNILNDDYGYVSQNDTATLKDLNRQIELDRAADFHATQKKITVNKNAVIKTIYEREIGKLPKKFKDTN